MFVLSSKSFGFHSVASAYIWKVFIFLPFAETVVKKVKKSNPIRKAIVIES